MNAGRKRPTFRWTHRLLFAVTGSYCMVIGGWAIATRNLNISRFFHPPVYLHDWDAILGGACLAVCGGLLLLLVFTPNRTGHQGKDLRASLWSITVVMLLVLPVLLLLFLAVMIKFAALGGPEFHDIPRSEHRMQEEPSMAAPTDPK